jgi:hypothetical protein
MSSLRISHQGRATGAPLSSAEKSRPEAANEGASFAVALGAANAPPKEAAAWLGDQTDETSDGAPSSHKRSGGSVKSDGAAATLAAAGVLAAMGQGASAASSATPAATPALSDGNTVGTIPGSTGQSSVAAALVGGWQTPAGIAVDAPSTAVAAQSTTTTDTGAVTSGGVAPGAMPMFLAGRMAPGHGQAVAAPPTDNAVSVADQATGNPAAPVSVDPSGGVGHTPISSPPDTTNASGVTPLASPSNPPGGSVSGASDAIVATATSSALAPSVTPSAGIASTNAASPAVASPIAATTTSSGQPNSNGAFGDGSFGAGERGHYTSVAASSASSDATTAAALGANSSGPVATAAAPGTTPTPDGNGTVAGTITDQVTDHLLRLVSNGSREMTMRLHPPELGDLTVRVAVSGRDVSAWFASPQPQVQNAINDALGQLQTNLGSAGYNLTGAWVGADGSSARQRGSELPAPPTPTSPASSSSALPAAVAAVSRPPASGLNIYV